VKHTNLEFGDPDSRPTSAKANTYIAFLHEKIGVLETEKAEMQEEANLADADLESAYRDSEEGCAERAELAAKRAELEVSLYRTVAIMRRQTAATVFESSPHGKTLRCDLMSVLGPYV
jgi:hypothetical protein